MQKKSQGFTIVELLIVVVVIAILAAITIVSYNGVTERARNLKTIAAARNYSDALQLYYSDNGTYPAISGNPTTDMCLGKIYTVDPTFGPDCITLTPNAVKASLGNELVPYSSNNQPEPDGTTYSTTGASVRGVRLSFLVDQKVDGVSRQWWLTYVLSGKPAKNACPVGPVAYGDWNNGDSTNSPNPLTMTPPSNGFQGDPLGSNAFQCRVPLKQNR
jgi:prepilin-type N-terminal cleavage/methylation domain-containing protein